MLLVRQRPFPGVQHIDVWEQAAVLEVAYNLVLDVRRFMADIRLPQYADALITAGYSEMHILRLIPDVVMQRIHMPLDHIKWLRYNLQAGTLDPADPP